MIGYTIGYGAFRFEIVLRKQKLTGYYTRMDLGNGRIPSL